MHFIRRLVAKHSKLLNAPWDWPADQKPPTTEEIGQLGEAIAARFLYTRGCKVLYTNYRAPEGGEIDITARHGKVLAFIEVKTRTSELYGPPSLAVDLEKRLLIGRGVRAWLAMLNHRDFGWRCDIVEVILTRGQPPKVRWIRSAFTVEETKQRAGQFKGKQIT